MLGYIFGASWEAIGDVLGYSSFLVLSLLIVILLVARLIKHARSLKRAHATNFNRSEVTAGNLEESSFIANAEISTKPSGNLPLL